MLNNLENIHTFVLSLLSVAALLIIFGIDNWYKTERTDHDTGSELRADHNKQCQCLVVLYFSLLQPYSLTTCDN